MVMESDFILQNILKELEADRKVIASAKIKSFITLGTGILFLIGAALSGILLQWTFFIGGGIVVIGIILNWRTKAATDIYRDSFKMKAVGAALRTIDTSLSIVPEAGITENEFVNTQLFTKSPDRFNSEDQVSGKAGKTSFSFSEVNAEYKTITTDNKGRRQEQWHEILKGIVFTGDFNKHFNGITVVRPNDIGSKIGGWLQKAVPVFFSKQSTKVELENTKFAETFLVHSTDQVEARYILTPAMMDKICELDSKCRYTISLSFINTRLYIAFPLTENYFEPPIYKSLLKPSCMERDLSVIRFMYGIVKELDLNTRIWGKD